MATTSHDKDDVNWRGQQSRLLTHLLMVAAGGVGTAVSHYYLYQNKPNLTNEHYNIFLSFNYITLFNMSITQLYTNNMRPVFAGDVIGTAILFPILLNLPAYVLIRKHLNSGNISFEWNTKTITFVGLYAIGSIMSNLCQLQRKWFKQDPKNKGKLYTKGLFSISRHPNYFGDLLLFTGWYGLSENYYTFIVPLLMFFNFYFNEIPNLEAYLKLKYSKQWKQYQTNVKSLIPFVL